MQERRVITILVLVGALFYVDNIFLPLSAAGILYPIVILCYISLDAIVMYFPRRPAIALVVGIGLGELWSIFNYTFLKKDCKQRMLPWGIFGGKISYCVIKRVIFQSLLSLKVSAAITLFRGRTDKLFFCNINIYRSTGTIDSSKVNEKYTQDMEMEMDRGMVVDKSDKELELT